MAITQVGTPATFSSDVQVTTCTVNVPTGVAAGDLLWWTICNNNATGVSVPSGWTQAGQSTTTGLVVGVFYKYATSSEPASYSATIASGRTTGTMSAWRGVHATTALDATPPSAIAGTTVVTLPGITTTTAGAVILGTAGNSRANGATFTYTATNADGFVGQIQTGAASGANVGSGTVYEAMPTAGSFTPTVTISAATTRSIGQTFALRPAAEAAQHESGGATATVTAASVGAGTASETASSGGSATTVAASGGAGTAAEAATGGGTTTATAVAIGAGSATEAASGGAGAVLEVTTTGGGTGTDDPPAEQHESGGGTVTLSMVALGAGVAAESAVGGELATVLVVSVGAGEQGGAYVEREAEAEPLPQLRTTTTLPALRTATPLPTPLRTVTPLPPLRTARRHQ